MTFKAFRDETQKMTGSMNDRRMLEPSHLLRHFRAFISLLITTIVLIFLPRSVVHSQCNKKPVIFNFGDSNSDTGGFSFGLGFNIGFPNGRTFFNGSSGRLCDGRLVIDFLCESLNASHLTPYLEPLEPNFTNGANFAVCGAATQPEFVPFALDVQVLQFLRFRARSPQLVSQGAKNLVGEEGFQNAVYIIDIGQNDLSAAFSAKLSYQQVLQRIPSFISEIRYALWNLYQHGAKNFWIHNTGPLGCLPQKLALFSKYTHAFDRYGCIKPLNDAAQAFNRGLSTLCDELRFEMNNATVVFTDMYAIKYEIIANAAYYGFQNPLMACCGYGGAPYNYNSSIGCGRTGCSICKEGSRYINWDGVHYTEAANAIFAAKILSTNYSKPPLKFGYFCHT